MASLIDEYKLAELDNVRNACKSKVLFTGECAKHIYKKDDAYIQWSMNKKAATIKLGFQSANVGKSIIEKMTENKDFINDKFNTCFIYEPTKAMPCVKVELKIETEDRENWAEITKFYAAQADNMLKLLKEYYK